MARETKFAIVAALIAAIIIYLILSRKATAAESMTSARGKDMVNLITPYNTDRKHMPFLFDFYAEGSAFKDGAGGTLVPITRFAAWPNLFDTYKTGTYGTVYTNSVSSGIPENPTMIVVMFIGEDCCRTGQIINRQIDVPSSAGLNNLDKNPLIGFFNQVEREFLSSQIKFMTIIIPAGTKTTLPLPRIFKYRQNGQILEYNGHNDFGELYDWIMEENQLF